MPRFKTDWSKYLHELRTRELAMVFGGCPAGCFGQGLELGAGDGFQSDLLLSYVGKLTVTDFYPRILEHPNTERKSHQVCDAEQVGESFPAGCFDLVFSSNLLEHLPQVERALAGIRKVLRDDGLSIHVMPSAFWKICQLALFAPDAVLSRLDRLGRGLRPSWLGGQNAVADPRRMAPPRENPAGLNNPTTPERRYSYLRRSLLPLPHGVSEGHWQEYRAFRQAHWRRIFQVAGFDVVAIIRGPVSSGYGFGLDGPRRICEGMGLASEHAFVTVKSGHQSPHVAHFSETLGDSLRKT